MKLPEDVHDRMREEWNERAREDAHYFVAFGRREQDDEEFFATATDLIRELETELKRLSANVPVAARRALEIGCGPGRLIRPMSRHFGEIHGIDVSDEMITHARRKLEGIPHAHLHAASGSDLAMFPSDHFDFVYSYAVFQHIPSADVVFSYLRETARVLKPGGIARLQINGLPKTSREYTTWAGVRVTEEEIHNLTQELGVQLLSLTGAGTQYMWTTWRKPLRCTIRAICNALTSEQAVPASGRMACAALTIANLPGDDCDLNSLEVRIDGIAGTVCYIGPQAHNTLTQVNVFLPPGVRTGLLPVALFHRGRTLTDVRSMRVIPPGPAVPRLLALTDGVNLLSPQRIESGLMKAVIDEVDDIAGFSADVDGTQVTDIDTFRTDPRAERWEVNFHLPAKIATGPHTLKVRLGKRLLAHTGIEVATLCLLAALGLHAATPEDNLRTLLQAKTGSVQLPSGTIEISREIAIPPSAHDLDIHGNNTILKAAPNFRGRALLVFPRGSKIKVRNLSLDGSRDAVGHIAVVPPESQLISRVVANNGILAEGVAGLEISAVKAAHVDGFGILIGSSHDVRLNDVEITESGGFDPERRNNGAGGVALEDGVTNFDISQCRFGGIRGNAITVRLSNHGRITNNEFAVIARDAIVVRHGNALVIEDNLIRQIGSPLEELAGRAECMRLEDFNDGIVRNNGCEQTLLGGMVITGSRNTISYNHLLHLNLALKNEAGIGLAGPATGNTIEGNVISGSGMNKHCVEVAPALPKDANKVLNNDCSDEASVAGLRSGPGKAE